MTDRFELLAANAADIVVHSDLDGIIKWISPSVREVLGQTPDEVIGCQAVGFIHPDDRAAMGESIDDVSSGDIARYEARFRCAGGLYRWMSVVVRPIRDVDGVVSSRVAGFRDIQREVELRGQLAEREEQLLLSMQCAPVGMAIVNLDRVLTIVNPALCDLLGATADRIEGTSIGEWISVADDAEDRTLRAAARSAVGTVSTEKTLHGVDGREIRVQHSIGVIRGVSGEPISYVSQFVDVTKDRRREKELAAERQRLRDTLDSLLDPHVVMEALRTENHSVVDFIVREANIAAAAELRVERDGLVGSLLSAVLPGFATRELMPMFAAAVWRGTPLQIDGLSIADPDGATSRWFDLRATRFDDGLSLTWRDVSDRFAKAQALRDSEERFRLLAQNSTDIVMHACDGRIVWASPSTERALGWHSDQLIDAPLRSFMHPDDRISVTAHHQHVRDGGRATYRLRALASNGTYRWVESHVAPYVSDDGSQHGMVLSGRVIDEQVAMEAALALRAERDPLTELLNRGEVLERIEGMLATRRARDAHVAIAFCDLDHFKTINDTFGHEVGDEVLATVARRLRSAVRAGDVVGRLGGDEFIVALPGIPDIDTATTVAEHILAAVGEPIQTTGGTLAPSVSIGVVLAGDDQNAAQVIARADEAMYAAKTGGRNRVVVTQ